VKAVDSHRHGLEPFLDVVPLAIVELTAQRTPSQGSQIAAGIDEKLDVDERRRVSFANQKPAVSGDVGDVVFLGEAMEERRPQKSSISDVRTRATLSATPRDRSRGG
jgi:hypothetical protein